MLRKNIFILCVVMILSSVHTVQAAGSSTDFSVSADSLMPDIRAGQSTDFSVHAGVSNIQTQGTSSDFIVTPIANVHSTTSSSSSVSSSATSSVSSSASSAIPAGSGGGGSERRAALQEYLTTQSAAHSAAPASSSAVRIQRVPVPSFVAPTDGSVIHEQALVDTETTTRDLLSEPHNSLHNSADVLDRIVHTHDQTPVLEFSVPVAGVYTVSIVNSDGVLVEKQEVYADGVMVLSRLASSLSPGKYFLSMMNAEGRTMHEVELRVLASNSTQNPFTIESFAGSPVSVGTAVIHIGRLVRHDTNVITGKATPFSQIRGYFRSTLRVSTTTADAVGSFVLPFPESLEDGSHDVTVVAVSADGTVLSHADFTFDLVTLSPVTFHFWLWLTTLITSLALLGVVTILGLRPFSKTHRNTASQSSRSKKRYSATR